MMTNSEKQEIRTIIEMAYMPIALKNNRYNGEDFLKVAFETMKILKAQNPDIDKFETAKVMMEFFNSKLNPPMSLDDLNGTAKLIAKYDSFESLINQRW